MPTISIFYGIFVRMYLNDNEQHNKPHIHIVYQNFSAVYSLEGELLSGELPPKKAKMVEVWIDIHYEDLMTNWNLTVNGKNPSPIKPL